LHLDGITNKIWGMKQFFVGLLELLKESGQGWSRDNASLFAAALAYYTIFALAPLLVIAVAVAGLVFREAAVEGQIVAQIGDTVGTEAAVIIESLITNASESGAGTIATVISSILLLLGASGLFSQLQRTLNIIWGLEAAPESGILNMIKKRSLAFGMVLIVGMLLLLSLAMSTIITAVGDSLAEWLPGIGSILPQLNFLASLIILTLLFAILFKVLPDAQITWKDVLLGSAVTTLLFMLGRYLIGLYLARGSATSAYGAAGSLVLILLWVYYSAQIFLFGAEFTQVYANKYGSRLKPANNAVWRGHEAATTSPNANQYRIVSVSPEENGEALSPAPASDWRQRLATGLLGLAAGLLLGFLGNLRQGKRN
jgi:membrane protein